MDGELRPRGTGCMTSCCTCTYIHTHIHRPWTLDQTHRLDFIVQYVYDVFSYNNPTIENPNFFSLLKRRRETRSQICFREMFRSLVSQG